MYFEDTVEKQYRKISTKSKLDKTHGKRCKQIFNFGLSFG